MTKFFHLSLLLSLMLCVQSFAIENERARYDICVGTGSVYNIPLPLHIRQSGEPIIRVRANYDTKPFQMPPYYQFRCARWGRNSTWELEFIHHKLYLTNNHSDIQRFTITNGYNFLMINRACKLMCFIGRIGLGWVIAHPESTVRMKKFDEHGGIRGPDTDGYFLSGAVVQAALEKRFCLTRRVYIYGELKGTAAYATVPIFGGHADAPNLAIHGLAGLGFSL